MATFAEDATLNTYTYDSDGFKKVENGGRVAFHHHLGWNGLSAGSWTEQSKDVPHRGVSDAQLHRRHAPVRPAQSIESGLTRLHHRPTSNHLEMWKNRRIIQLISGITVLQ